MPVITNCTCDVCGASLNDSDLLANPDLRRVKLNGIWAARQETVQRPEATSDDVVVTDAVLGSNDATAPEMFCGYAHAAQWFAGQTY